MDENTMHTHFLISRRNRFKQKLSVKMRRIEFLHSLDWLASNMTEFITFLTYLTLNKFYESK